LNDSAQNAGMNTTTMTDGKDLAVTPEGSKSRIALAALVVMRITLAGWVGAAVLFVITSIAEQVSPDFNSTTRDQLATIRFPFYYATGVVCCTLALASGVLCRSISGRATVALILVVAAAIVLALDYCFVYGPLQDLIIPPGQQRTEQFSAQFDELHTWSRNVNTFHLLLILLAAVQVSLPARRKS